MQGEARVELLALIPSQPNGLIVVHEHPVPSCLLNLKHSELVREQTTERTQVSETVYLHYRVSQWTMHRVKASMREGLSTLPSLFLVFPPCRPPPPPPQHHRPHSPPTQAWVQRPPAPPPPPPLLAPQLSPSKWPPKVNLSGNHSYAYRAIGHPYEQKSTKSQPLRHVLLHVQVKTESKLFTPHRDIEVNIV